VPRLVLPVNAPILDCNSSFTAGLSALSLFNRFYRSLFDVTLPGEIETIQPHPG
jgi:hypothetical protein